MKNRNIVKTLGAFALSGFMLMGTTIPTFAHELSPARPGITQGTEDTPVKLEITKDFQFAEGLDIPTVKFDFTATKITTDAPNATIASVEYSNVDKKEEAVDGKHTVSKNAKLTFDKEFPHAGVYEYEITETAGNQEGITYDTQKYIVEVHVANNTAMDGKTYVKAIVSKDKDTKEKKPIKFVNTYTKDAQLVIEKQVTGELADLTKQFEFKLTLKKSAISTKTTFTGNIVRKDGTQESIEFTDNAEQTIKLAHGDKLEFTSLPVGTTYEVIEVGVKDGYTPKVTVVENDKETVKDHKVDESKDVSTKTNGKDNLVGEHENQVTFVNEYEEITVTGIIENNLPFILLIGIAGVGLGALAVIKRRKLAK